MIQDDAREQELIKLFNLHRPENSGRSGTDAILKLDGNEIHFELKSTTRGSVTTVRDFGPDHIQKWRGKHWLIGFYDNHKRLLYCIYGSPAMMDPWINEKANYVKVDFALAELVPSMITHDLMYELVGKKASYSLQDAKNLQKKQYNVQRYREMMDLPSGYSPDRMLEILKDRCKYLILRGSTLNNPHIPESYFRGCERITSNHPDRLRDLVRAAIE
jgi:hypothetical protein